MEENQIEERELSEREQEIALIGTLVGNAFEHLFTLTHTEDWKRFDTLEEQLAFRNVVEAYFASASIVREKFDSDIWKGHSDGTVNPLITSIRKQREGDKPGKKAEPVTAESVLAKRLKK